jgi:ABC-2 type transport system ATP-binding protein
MHVIYAKKVRRSFSGIPILKNIDLEIDRGERHIIFGIPDSGKTVFIKILLDLLNRDSGYIEIFGKDPTLHRREVMSDIIYIPQHPRFPEWMKPMQHLRAISRVYKRNIRETLREIIRDHKLARMIGHPLSKWGEKEIKRYLLTLSIAIKPRLTIIDDLRDQDRELLQTLYKETGDDNTIIATSNELRTVSRYSDRTSFINEGSIEFIGEPEKLEELIRDTYILIKVSGTRREIWQKIGDIEGISEVSIRDKILKVRIKEDLDILNQIKNILDRSRIKINWMRWLKKKRDIDDQDNR